MSLSIKNHRFEGKWFAPSKKNDGRIILDKLRFIVIHYTAGFTDSAAFLGGSATVNSAHLVVTREGVIQQLVDFNRKANHAGESEWKGYKLLNGYSIGIEIENVGPIYKAGDGSFKSYVGNKRFDPADVVEAAHKNPKVAAEWKYWERYTEAQLNAVRDICQALMAEYPQIQEIVGHDDIAPNRKQDPGPAFPMSWLKDQATARHVTEETEAPSTSDEFEVTTQLNVRSGPGASHPTVSFSPLWRGAKVKILKQEGDWAFITINRNEGWVHTKYLRAI